jgi:tRNA(Ile)-lysidine synthase TilS/MesJ
MQRVVIKNMLKDWEQKFPGRIETIFSSMRNVAASQLADPKLFDFAGLEQLRARNARSLESVSAAITDEVMAKFAPIFE